MNTIHPTTLKHSRPKMLSGGGLRTIASVIPLLLASVPALAATAVDQPSVLATADQRAVESRAIAIFATPQVKAQIAKSHEQFLRSPVAADAESRSTVDNAVEELAFAATLNAVNSDALRPRVVWAFTPPRRWLGHQVPGRVQAVLAGDNAALPRIDLLAPTVKIRAGDQVVSSGDGGLLPPGLPIGTVVADGDGFRVALLADAAQSESVEILNFARPPEALPALPVLPAEAAGQKPYLPPPPPPVAVAAPQPETRPKLVMPPISQSASEDAGVE